MSNKPIISVPFKNHKVFIATFFIMLAILLARIPLGTFNQPSVVDIFGHFLLPASGAPLLYFLLSKFNIVIATKKRHVFFLIVLLGITSEVLWEICEFIVDAATELQWQVSNLDTMTDIILGVGGALTGAFIYACYYARR